MRTTPITAVQHAFYSGLYSNQMPLKKVTGVALAGLLLIGALFLLFRSQKSSSVPRKDPRDYPLLCETAIISATSKMPKGIAIIPFSSTNNSGSPIHQPIDIRITQLHTSYFKTAHPAFVEICQLQPVSSWQNQPLITATNNIVEITYAISRLTLDDLTPFIQKIFNDTEQSRTPAQALVATDSYQRQTCYLFGFLYHLIRSKNCDTESFYEANTITGHWRMLYNNYCGRVRTHISEEELRLANPQYVAWTRADTDQNTFTPCLAHSSES